MEPQTADPSEPCPVWVCLPPHPDTPSAGAEEPESDQQPSLLPCRPALVQGGDRGEWPLPVPAPSTDTPPEGLRPPHTEPLVSPSRLSTQAGPGGRWLSHLSPLSSQAGCENPSISLHVIGLNGPTHDLEMTPPDDPRMRFASFVQLRDDNNREIHVCLCGLCGLRLPI